MDIKIFYTNFYLKDHLRMEFIVRNGASENAYNYIICIIWPISHRQGSIDI